MFLSPPIYQKFNKKCIYEVLQVRSLERMYDNTKYHSLIDSSFVNIVLQDDTVQADLER